MGIIFSGSGVNQSPSTIEGYGSYISQGREEKEIEVAKKSLNPSDDLARQQIIRKIFPKQGESA